MERKYHPILEQPHAYSIINIHWGILEDADESASLDITFRKDDITRKLRFTNPQQVQIDLSGGFPQDCGDMTILDIRGMGWEGLTVEVTEGGASGSPVTLYAKEVIDLE